MLLQKMIGRSLHKKRGQVNGSELREGDAEKRAGFQLSLKTEYIGCC